SHDLSSSSRPFHNWPNEYLSPSFRRTLSRILIETRSISASRVRPATPATTTPLCLESRTLRRSRRGPTIVLITLGVLPNPPPLSSTVSIGILASFRQR